MTIGEGQPTRLGDKMGDSRFFLPDVSRHHEHSPITPESLLADNQSDRAKEGRDMWRAARKNGQLTGVRACADARLLIPDLATTRVRTIAAGGPEQEYTSIFNDPGIKTIVIMTHISGDTVERGKAPSGCGGLIAKGEHLSDTAIGRFVGEHVASTDVLVQTLYSAATTARRSGKDTLAAVQDHLDGTIYPVAVITDEGTNIATDIPIEYLMFGQYNPEKIYEKGIPVLHDRELPQEFDAFLEAGRRQMTEVHYAYPKLREMQKVQNPGTIVISSEAIPLQSCFPSSFQEPGSVFKISMPRDAIDAPVPIEPNHLAIALAQVEYPIANSVKNHGTDGSFADTSTILIETGNLEVSKRLAVDLMEGEITQRWAALQDRQILVSEMREGIARKIEPFQTYPIFQS